MGTVCFRFFGRALLRFDMAQFEGKFVNTKDENLDEFYTAIGIPWVPRKMLTASSPTMAISSVDGTWTIEISTLHLNHRIHLKWMKNMMKQCKEAAPSRMLQKLKVTK